MRKNAKLIFWKQQLRSTRCFQCLMTFILTLFRIVFMGNGFWTMWWLIWFDLLCSSQQACWVLRGGQGQQQFVCSTRLSSSHSWLSLSLIGRHSRMEKEQEPSGVLAPGSPIYHHGWRCGLPYLPLQTSMSWYCCLLLLLLLLLILLFLLWLVVVVLTAALVVVIDVIDGWWYCTWIGLRWLMVVEKCVKRGALLFLWLCIAHVLILSNKTHSISSCFFPLKGIRVVAPPPPPLFVWKAPTLSLSALDAAEDEIDRWATSWIEKAHTHTMAYMDTEEGARVCKQAASMHHTWTQSLVQTTSTCWIGSAPKSTMLQIQEHKFIYKVNSTTMQLAVQVWPENVKGKYCTIVLAHQIRMIFNQFWDIFLKKVWGPIDLVQAEAFNMPQVCFEYPVPTYKSNLSPPFVMLPRVSNLVQLRTTTTSQTVKLFKPKKPCWFMHSTCKTGQCDVLVF